MNKRIAGLLLAIALLLPLAPAALADGYAADAALPELNGLSNEPTAVFYLDGVPLEGVAAESFGGTYYVALASILPALDPACVTEEDAERAMVTGQAVVVTETPPTEEFPEGQAVAEVLDTLTMTAVKGEHYVTANGRCLYVEDGVRTVSGMTAIPVRTLAQILAMNVNYDAASGQVFLSSPLTPGYLADAEAYYDADSLYWLSRIIYCESGNQSLEGKIAVGNVVMNRVRDGSFPNTVHDVIFQKNQFSPAASGSIYREPNEESVLAAKLVLDGAKSLNNVLFFNRAGMDCYASRNRSYVATIGEHAFYA